MDKEIEVIRNTKLKISQKLTLSDIRKVVNSVLSCNKNLEEISLETKISEEKVLDIVAEFGTWLTHVSGGTTLLPLTIEKQDLEQPDLFEETIARNYGVVTLASLTLDDQIRACRLNKSQRKSVEAVFESKGERAAKKEIKKLLSDLYAAKPLSKKSKKKSIKPPTKVVLVPEGFEKTSKYKRDVSKAYCAIIERNPDDEVITRFLQRHYSNESKALSFPLIASVWFFLKIGRADQLIEVSPNNTEFIDSVLECYDLLDVSRKDALEAVEYLCSGNVDFNDLSYLDALIKKSFWLCESEFLNIQRKLETALIRDVALSSLKFEVERFVNRVKSNPTKYMPSKVSELSLGQVRRIAQLSGLDVDNDARELENNVRERLKTLGLTSDLDKLLPAGVRAAKVGRDDDFFEILQSRKLGELDWHLQLEEFFSSLSEEVDKVTA